jgi:DNA-binding transcriptional MerR regulator
MGDWMTVPQAARLAGVPVRTMRRRLHILDRRSGGHVLRRYGPGRSKIWVHYKALLHELRSDPEIMGEQLATLESRLSELERRVTALRGAHHGLADLVELERKNQQAWREACEATLQGLQRMALLSHTANPGQSRPRETDPYRPPEGR